MSPAEIDQYYLSGDKYRLLWVLRRRYLSLNSIVFNDMHPEHEVNRRGVSIGQVMSPEMHLLFHLCANKSLWCELSLICDCNAFLKWQFTEYCSVLLALDRCFCSPSLLKAPYVCLWNYIHRRRFLCPSRKLLSCHYGHTVGQAENYLIAVAN